MVTKTNSRNQRPEKAWRVTAKTALLLLAGMLWQLVVMAQCTLSIAGTVTDEDTKQPLSAATITIMETGEKGMTDATGRFLLKGICPGNYTVKVTHNQCRPVQMHVHVQKDVQLSFVMPHTVNELQEVTVVAAANAKSGAIGAELKGKEMDASRGQSLAEALQRLSGVTMLQTGTNIAKPVIHGLHSNRVLMLNNGIRQEGQQWGSEHAPEIDPFIANRLTVIKGASTLRYGADAIGGVVLVEPKLLRYQPGIGGEISAGFFSNNRQAFMSGMVEGNAKKHPAFSWRVQGTYKRGGNARTPNYWLANSGMQEMNFSTAAGWKKPNKGLELFYSQFNTKLGIFSGSHIGNVTDLMNIINNGQPPSYVTNAAFSYSIDRPYQQIQHHLAKAKAFVKTGANSRLNAILSYQYNWRREYDIKRFSSSSNAPQMDIGLQTIGADVVWDHYAGKQIRGSVGVQSSYQFNSYTQRFFIPNYQAINAGVFAIEKYSKKQFAAEIGVRYDVRSIFDIHRNNGRTYYDRNYGSLSANGGASYHLNDWITAAINLSTAWRAPQVNELYSDGLHHGSARIEKGNPNLNPERANSVMLSLNVQRKNWQAEVVWYHKQINDFIFLRPTFPPQLTIRGAFPTFLYDQTNARISGVDFSSQYAFNSHIAWQLKASFVRAFDKKANDWIIQMPADRFENALTYQFADGKRWKDPFIKLQWQWVLEQTRVPATGDIEVTLPNGSKQMASDYAAPPAAYHLLGMEAGITQTIGKKPVKWLLTGSNLLNTVYRDYMNAFRYYADEMGINIALKVQVPIGQ